MRKVPNVGRDGRDSTWHCPLLDRGSLVAQNDDIPANMGLRVKWGENGLPIVHRLSRQPHPQALSQNGAWRLVATAREACCPPKNGGYGPAIMENSY